MRETASVRHRLPRNIASIVVPALRSRAVARRTRIEACASRILDSLAEYLRPCSESDLVRCRPAKTPNAEARRHAPRRRPEDRPRTVFAERNEGRAE